MDLFRNPLLWRLVPTCEGNRFAINPRLYIPWLSCIRRTFEPASRSIYRLFRIWRTFESINTAYLFAFHPHEKVICIVSSELQISSHYWTFKKYKTMQKRCIPVHKYMNSFLFFPYWFLLLSLLPYSKIDDNSRISWKLKIYSYIHSFSFYAYKPEKSHHFPSSSKRRRFPDDDIWLKVNR